MDAVPPCHRYLTERRPQSGRSLEEGSEEEQEKQEEDEEEEQKRGDRG